MSNQLGPNPPTANRIAVYSGDAHLLKEPNASIDAVTQKIINVVDPASAQDAATKNYVDTRDRDQVTFFSTSAPATTSTRYCIAQNVAANAVETNGVMLFGVARTATEIRIHHTNAISGDTLAWTFRINGVDTALTATVASGGTTASLTGQSVAVAKGDRGSMSLVQSSTTAQASLAGKAAVTLQ